MESLKKVYEKITSEPPLYFLWTIAVVNVIISIIVSEEDVFINTPIPIAIAALSIICALWYLAKVKQNAIEGITFLLNTCFAIYLWVESLKFELDGWVAAAVVYTLIIVVFYIWFLYDMFAHLRKLEDFEKGYRKSMTENPARDLRFRIEI